jgi:ankyrin repeat protein
LLDANADVDIQDVDGFTPALRAALNGYRKIAKLLKMGKLE